MAAQTSKYDLHFQQQLAKLNIAQTQAVHAIEGPVLVIAGPGTGKTQILSARIGYILASEDLQVQPHNILCLTFTDAGTVAMRKRLLEFIGPDAYRVHVYTFHGFCNQVIQENLDYFGIRNLQPISELETIEIYQKLIDNFDSKSKLKRFKGDIYYDQMGLKDLFKNMKQEGWSEQNMYRLIDQYVDELKDDPEYQYKRKSGNNNKGDLKASYYSEIEKMEKLKAAIAEFSNFNKAMGDIRRYDYDDMILWVLKAFKENNLLLRNYQERYQYILVDEYQDTSGSQNEIVDLLASYWERPNLFVVGDDDQSVYRFQGANIKNIIDFNVKYTPELIVLKENYRSTQAVLDASMAVIKHNKERLVNSVQGLDKELLAKGLVSSSVIKPQIIEYYNRLHEEAAIVEHLEQLHQEGIDLSEVAVIYRKHSNVADIIKVLEKRKIPLNIKKSINVLELPFVQNLIDILRYIQKENDYPDSGEEELFRLMHFEYFKIDPRDIANIARKTRRTADSPSIRWRELMAKKSELESLKLHSLQSILDLEANLVYWQKEFHNITLQVLFEKITTRGGVLSWIMNNSEKTWYMQVLTTFFDFLKEETARKPLLLLKEFLLTLQKMMDNDIRMNLQKIIHADKGVNFVTSHSSKGLEFKYVFLIGCISKNWEGQSARSSGFKIPSTITEVEDHDQVEDERRLFYVALTRAKEFLFISYPAKDENEKEFVCSRFIIELTEDESIKIDSISVSDDTIVSYKLDTMQFTEPPIIPLIDSVYLDALLEKYALSVTHLNKYLKCPIAFYFENMLMVPSARTASSGFGTAVHEALKDFFAAMVSNPEKQFPTVEYLCETFKMKMKNVHSHFTLIEYKNYEEYGATIVLPELYNAYVETWHKDVLLEHKIDHVEYKGVPIKGNVDKIELFGKDVNVIDYKTGKYTTNKTKLLPPTEKEPNGGDYWRQIVFYKLLIENDRKTNYSVISGELDFVEPDATTKQQTKHKVFISPEDEQVVGEQVVETYTRIINHKFDTGCGKEDCTWCNFVRYNYTPVEMQLSSDEE
ncbi:ATP-dependent DNA helicase [uncultured Cytophaga sp.]|uniref:ATP-dependent helicase n=1 Tax=uncultured Cytophaga sp. TaxID=160238 RepID=UPI00262333DC|nr:ATP-dependent DNA helicase [uncultured Cytophaga sp.]